MKTKILLCVLVLMLLAADLPPQLPSSFYGTATGYPVDTRINARVDGQLRAYAFVIDYPGYGLVYSLDVPGDPAVDEGKAVVFKVAGVVVGRGVWHSGTNTELNLAKPARKK